MRITNKILIEGDTMKIFEEFDPRNGLKVGNLVKINPEASQQSGLDPNKSYEILDFVTYGNGPDATINVILDKDLYQRTHYSPNPRGCVAIDYVNKEMQEGSFNPMKGEKKELNLEPIFSSRDKKGYMLYKSAENPDLIFAEKGGVLYDTDDMGNPTTSLRMKLFNVNGLVNEHQGSLMVNGKYVRTYVPNADKSYSVVYDDGTKDTIMVSHNDWHKINALHYNGINESKKAKTDPADKKKADKTNYGHKDMSDVDMVNPYELRKGIRIEMVDVDDYEKAMDKAVKKLKKDPMFYSNMIASAKAATGKRSDVPTEIKDKKLNKVSDKLKDKANEMEVSKKDATKVAMGDSLNKKEKAKGKPKGVKEMTMTPKKSKGMKSMDVPGKEKKTNLKESVSIFNSLKKLLLS